MPSSVFCVGNFPQSGRKPSFARANLRRAQERKDCQMAGAQIDHNACASNEGRCS
jgi:hypothetical protein